MNTENCSYEVNVVKCDSCTRKKNIDYRGKISFSYILHVQVHDGCLRGELVV